MIDSRNINFLTEPLPSNAEQFRVYVQSTDNTIDFEVDHAYFVDGEVPTNDDYDQLIINGDFEHGNSGWVALSNPFTLHNNDSPSGQTHAQMSGRTKTFHGFKRGCAFYNFRKARFRINFKIIENSNEGY